MRGGLSDVVRFSFAIRSERLRAAYKYEMFYGGHWSNQYDAHVNCERGSKFGQDALERPVVHRARAVLRAKCSLAFSFRLITYWPARSMLTHFRRRNSRRASPVKVLLT